MMKPAFNLQGLDPSLDRVFSRRSYPLGARWPIHCCAVTNEKAEEPSYMPSICDEKGTRKNNAAVCALLVRPSSKLSSPSARPGGYDDAFTQAGAAPPY